jgi:hypothetical protein
LYGKGTVPTLWYFLYGLYKKYHNVGTVPKPYKKYHNVGTVPQPYKKYHNVGTVP